MNDRPKLVYRQSWCVLWRNLLYPFGKIEDAAGAASNEFNRHFNPFTGYTQEQAAFLGYK
jgi:hypothetical protein